MKRQQRIVADHVLMAVLSIILIVLIGVGCFLGIVKIFGVEIIEDNFSVEKKVIASTISIDREVCNLIYSVNYDENLIDGMILEFFNTNTGKIDYLTVPANLKAKTSEDFRKEMIKYGYKMEESFMMSKLIQAFGKENAYQYGELILEDILDIDISYYTCFKNNILAKYFVQNVEKFYLNEGDKFTEHTYDRFELSETYIAKCDQVENDIKALIEKGYKDLSSNLSLNNKLSYLNCYEDTEMEKIFYWHVIGKEKNEQFNIEKKTNKKLIKYILDRSKQYEVTQKEYNQAVELGNAKK